MDDMFEIFEPRILTDSSGGSLPCRVMKPEGFDPKIDYPALLFLHGSGGNGDDNIGNLTDANIGDMFASEEWRNTYPSFVLLPQCPIDHSWVKDIRRSSYPEVKHKVLRILDTIVASNNIDTNRIYITGISRGGFGTFGMVVERPNMFAAAVPICGGWDPKDAPKLAHVPFWVFHGAADSVIDPNYSRDMVEALKTAATTVRYTEYASVGHDVWTLVYKKQELWEWLFQQKKR